MLKLCVLALFVAYADAGVKDGFCVCETSGRYQYQTFDDAIIRFDGLCSFKMVKNKPSAGRQFDINVLNEKNGDVFKRTVTMLINNNGLIIKPGNKFFVRGVEVRLPYNKNGINVRMKGDTLEVYLAWMLTILFDGKLKLTIKVPAAFRGHLLGMCGDCNGDTTDDFRTKNSAQVLVKSPEAEARIGKSYMIKRKTSTCRAKAVTDKCDANRKCFQMLADPFKACINGIGLQRVLNFMDSCKVDVCMGKNNKKDTCGAFERLANECARQNSPVQWKKLTGCEGPCDKKPCKNNGKCIPNSSNDNYTCNCTKKFVGDNCEIDNPCLKKPCQNGGTCLPNKSSVDGYTCNCDMAYIGTKCEQRNMCVRNPCRGMGTCNTVDGTFKCTCKNGYMGKTCEKDDPCFNNPCTNGGSCKRTKTGYKCICKLGNKGDKCQFSRDNCVCRAFGDPHYITFDGQLINFMGKCKYTLAATKSASNLRNFSIEVKNEHRGNTRVSYTRFVDLKINGNTFRMLPGSKLKVNGYLMILPLTNYLGVNAIFSLGWIIIWTDFGLKIEFDGEHRVIVTVPSKYMGQLTGICGDCNLKKDDYKTKSGVDVSSSKNKFSLIGTSYQVVDDSDKPETNCTVIDYVADCTYSETRICNNFILMGGVFTTCVRRTPRVRTQIYFEACKADVCAHKSFPKIIKKIVCQAFEAFAKECEEKNLFTKWRYSLDCPKKCDGNQRYMFKTKLCQRNCFPLFERCTGKYGEGCVCKRPLVLMGDTCVKSHFCGCSYNGMEIKLYRKVMTPNCSERVKCLPRNRVQRSRGCAANEDCLLQSGNRVCQCSPPFKKENSKCLAPTLPENEMTSALEKFVRVTMAKIKGKPLKTISSSRPGVCAVVCRNNTECKSFTFDEMKDECKLFSVNAVNQTLVSVNCPFQDYYQLIESQKIVIRGGTIFPCGPLTEYAVVKTLEDCKAKCNKNNCKSMEYSVVSQECSISKSTEKDFEIIGDSEFVFYGDLPLIAAQMQTVTKS